MYVVVYTGTRKSNKDFKGAIQMEQLLFYISHYEAPSKPLISTYQVINHQEKTIQNKTTTRTTRAKNKSVVVVVKKI